MANEPRLNSTLRKDVDEIKVVLDEVETKLDDISAELYVIRGETSKVEIILKGDPDLNARGIQPRLYALERIIKILSVALFADVFFTALLVVLLFVFLFGGL